MIGCDASQIEKERKREGTLSILIMKNGNATWDRSRNTNKQKRLQHRIRCSVDLDATMAHVTYTTTLRKEGMMV